MIPVTIITGFLGAGKTTLLNHVLSENHGVRAAVLVNDFGAINIDAKLIVGVEGETVNLANGCVCCTIRDDLVGACLGLLERDEPPEHLLIELSGVSDPIPVLNTFLETDLGTLFSFSTILSLVDSEQLPNLQKEKANLARIQIQSADIIVLNKIDLINQESLVKVKNLVREIGPGSRVIEVIQGRVPLELVFGDNNESSKTWKGLEKRNNDDHGFLSWSWTCDRPLSLPKLRLVLEQLPDKVYRCKGVIHLEEMPPYQYVLQMVGKRYHLVESGGWGPNLPKSEIVLIGELKNIDLETFQQAFDTCIGNGDDSGSPVLRLMRKIAPELMDVDTDYLNSAK